MYGSVYDRRKVIDMNAVTIKVNGVLSTYILVKGVGKILDQNMSYSFKFTARK